MHIFGFAAFLRLPVTSTVYHNTAEKRSGKGKEEAREKERESNGNTGCGAGKIQIVERGNEVCELTLPGAKVILKEEKKCRGFQGRIAGWRERF